MPDERPALLQHVEHNELVVGGLVEERLVEERLFDLFLKLW